jgi:hypothetical protein
MGRNDPDSCVYCVEMSGIEPTPPARAETDALEHYPEFWPLDMPLERPRMPATSPRSNAELEWLVSQLPNETAASSPGLTVAAFDAAGDPQLKWIHWSRSSEDRIPWADGEPREADGSSRGRIIVKGAKCYTVFDSIPRPQLFGDVAARPIAWAMRRVMQADVPAIGKQLSAGSDGAGLSRWTRFHDIEERYNDFVGRGSVAYWPEVANSDPAWRGHLDDLARINDLVRSARPVQYLPARSVHFDYVHVQGSRLLTTPFVCSREVAERIAAACKAHLPSPADQEELNAVAKLLPQNRMAHCGITPETSRGLKLWRENESNAPLTIQAAPSGEGSLRRGLTRALLVLEWPDEASKERRRVKLPP